MTDFDNDQLFGKNLTVYGESKMIDPDYKIEEIFDPERMEVYFRVYALNPSTTFVNRRFETLDKAKDCVRMCRKYENRVFHYVED
jgi:hypothetical protein